MIEQVDAGNQIENQPPSEDFQANSREHASALEIGSEGGNRGRSGRQRKIPSETYGPGENAAAASYRESLGSRLAIS